MVKVIVINGFPGSGKDTFVKMLCEINTGAPIVNIHTIDPVKAAASHLGWKQEKTPEIRDFLANLKVESDRLFKTSFNYVDRIVSICQEPGVILFIHSREQVDIEYYVKEYGAKTLLVVRNDLDLTGITNRSDLRVLDIHYDYIIPNTGTLEELRESAKILLKDLRAKE